MKKTYIIALLIIMSSAFLFEQQSEQLIVPKTKKKYVSEQQYAELEGQMVMVINCAMDTWAELNAASAQLPQVFSSIQKKSLCTINDYIDGEKSCFLKTANKIQRTDCYDQLLKCKNTIQSYSKKMKNLQQQIETMSRELQQQFQAITTIMERNDE